jgi:hypothetical protein
MRLRFAFAASRSRIRFGSETQIAPYFDSQLTSVARLIPCRMLSLLGPIPASHPFRISTLCDSKSLDFLMIPRIRRESLLFLRVREVEA